MTGFTCKAVLPHPQQQRHFSGLGLAETATIRQEKRINTKKTAYSKVLQSLLDVGEL
jgi:hypothetical protein